MAASVKELSSTIQTFKMLFEGLQVPQSLSGPSSVTAPLPAQQDATSALPVIPAREEGTPGVSREETGEQLDSTASDSKQSQRGKDWTGSPVGL